MTVRHRYTPTDPRLGRHVEHDPRSRDYAVTAKPAELKSVRHQRHVPVFDQGQVGSCTANAAGGALATGPAFATVGHTVLGRDATSDEDTVVGWYSLEQEALGYGPYPPADNGGSGLAIAKVLKTLGLITGYRHAFSLDATLAALAAQPVIIGIPWLAGMFTPDTTGHITPAGDVQGGHEVVLDELDVEQERVWLTNSWGPSWGVKGRGWLTFDHLGQLLADQGDCTVLLTGEEVA